MDMTPDEYTPQPQGGVSWRYLSSADAAALNMLVQRIEAIDNPPYRSSWQDVTRFFAGPMPWSAVGGFDEQGIMRCFGHVRIRDGAAKDAICYGGVDPAWRRRGLGGASLIWQTSVSEHILSHMDNPGMIRVYVEDEAQEWIGHLVDAGYERTSTFIEMTLMFDSMAYGTIDELCEERGIFFGQEYRANSPFVQIVPWSSDMSEQVRKATGRLSGGTADISEEGWNNGWEHFEPQASFILLDKRTDRSRVVGYVLATTYPQDFAVLGRKQGSIEMMAIDSEFYSYTPKMFDAVVGAYREMGFEAIGASAEDAEGADASDVVTMYGECGFAISSQNHMYTKVPRLRRGE